MSHGMLLLPRIVEESKRGWFEQQWIERNFGGDWWVPFAVRDSKIQYFVHYYVQMYCFSLSSLSSALKIWWWIALITKHGGIVVRWKCIWRWYFRTILWLVLYCLLVSILITCQEIIYVYLLWCIIYIYV